MESQMEGKVESNNPKQAARPVKPYSRFVTPTSATPKGKRPDSRFVHLSTQPCLIHGCSTVGEPGSLPEQSITATGAAIPPPYRNPSRPDTTWFHGTSFEPDEDDEYAHDGGTLRPPAETGHGDDDMDGRRGQHWNTDLGIHFTSLRKVAHEFAAKGANEDSRILHAGLHMANPKHFEDEEEMADHAIDWATKNKHKFLQGATSSERAKFARGEYGSLASEEDEDNEHLGFHMDRTRDIVGGSEKAINKIDARGSKAPGVEEHEKNMWLGQHPNRDQLTHNYVQHLKDQGHDGITYGNSVEGPYKHTCAIAFDDTPIHHRKWEWLSDKRPQHKAEPEWNPNQTRMKTHVEPDGSTSLKASLHEGAWKNEGPWETHIHGPREDWMRRTQREHADLNHARYLEAENATNGYMVNQRGKARGISGEDFFRYGPRPELHNYASDELKGFLGHPDAPAASQTSQLGAPESLTSYRSRKRQQERDEYHEYADQHEGEHSHDDTDWDDFAAKFGSKDEGPMEFPYMRNTVSSTGHVPKGDRTYDQHLEPAGRYMTHRPANVEAPEGWESGVATFHNPLHVDAGEYRTDTSWKKVISDRFGGATGKELSKRLVEHGHDAIITHDKYGIGEVVDMTHLHRRKAASGGWSHGEFPSGLKYRERSKDLGGGLKLRHIVDETGGGISVTDGDKHVADLHYTTHDAPNADGEGTTPVINIGAVDTKKSHRRRGLASTMYGEIRDAHPDRIIPASSVLEPDGRRLVKSLAERYPDVHRGRLDVDGNFHEGGDLYRPPMLENKTAVMDEWRPTERLFAPTSGGVDPILFDDKKSMRPKVRREIIEVTNKFFRSHGYGDNPAWARVYLAGSQASEWYGNRDFDILIGLNYPELLKQHPELDHFTRREIDQRFNTLLRDEFNNDSWRPSFDPKNEWDRTGYVNAESWDIRQIKPYAAYNVTDDRWAVKPIHEPNGHRFNETEWYYFEGFAAEAREALSLPEPARTRRCSQVWDFVHSDRSRAFGPHGEGAFDRGNALEKYLDQSPYKRGKSLMQALADERYGKTAAVTHRPEYDPEAGYDENRKRRDDWESGIRHALSMGHITNEEAHEHGYSGVGHDQDDTGRLNWKPLPHTLYHVTTDGPAVHQTGLKSRDELSQSQGRGLGGGESDSISFTEDPEVAKNIHDSLHEFHKVLNGHKTINDMVDEASRGHGANEPYDDFIRSSAGEHRLKAWGQGREYKSGFGTEEENKGWTPHGDKVAGIGYQHWTRPATDEEKLYHRSQVYKSYAAGRDWSGGKSNPLFFDTDLKGFADSDPSKFSIIKAHPKPGAQGYQLGALGEWRTSTGDAVEVDHNHRQASTDESGVEYIDHNQLRKMYSGDYDVPMAKIHSTMMRNWSESPEERHPSEVEHGGVTQYINHLKADIANNGMREPITVRGGNVVVDGNHRGAAAMALGMDRIPIRHVAIKGMGEYFRSLL